MFILLWISTIDAFFFVSLSLFKVMVPGQPMEGNESILDTGDFATELPSTPPPPMHSADSVKAKPEPKSEVSGGNDMQTSASVSHAASDTISLRYY